MCQFLLHSCPIKVTRTKKGKSLIRLNTNAAINLHGHRLRVYYGPCCPRCRRSSPPSSSRRRRPPTAKAKGRGRAAGRAAMPRRPGATPPRCVVGAAVGIQGGIDNRNFPQFSAIFCNFPQFSAILATFLRVISIYVDIHRGRN